MHVLICTIIRNRRPYLFLWKDQILALKDENPEVTFDLSVFENDSNDTTPEYLEELRPELEAELNKVIITCGKENWPYFRSIKDDERVDYLAKARNKALNQILSKNLGYTYDKIIFIEPDIDYDPEQISKLLYTDDDIASPYSLHPIEFANHRWIYDSWATRLTPQDEIFKGPRIFDMPKRLDVAATFNCFCVYNADPFYEGARFSGTNPLTNRWDCDTTNICFEFAFRGYKEFGLYNIPVTHLDN